jgi:hypothetical protein
MTMASGMLVLRSPVLKSTLVLKGSLSGLLTMGSLILRRFPGTRLLA